MSGYIGGDDDGGGGGDGTDDVVFSVLELLAEEAAVGRIDALLQRARRSGSPPAALARAERAVQLAREVHASFERGRQREAGFAALVDTARDLTLPYDLDTLLSVITRRVRLLLHFDMAYVSLRDSDSDSDDAMVIHTSEGSTTALNTGLRVEGGSGLGHRALTTGAPLWTADYLNDDTIPHSAGIDEVVEAEGLRAIMAVPLRHGDTNVGVLYGADRKVRHYTPDEIGLICSLADLAAVAIEKAGLLQQAQDQVAELELDGFRTRTSLIRLEQLGESYSRIMGLLVAGADLTSVAKAAGDALDGTLQMRDPAGGVVAAGGEIPDLDEDAIAKGVLAAHAQRAPVLADERTWVTPVVAGTEDLGVLVLRPVTRLVGQDSWLLQTTAQAFAVHLLMQRSAAVAEGPVRDELLDELLDASASTQSPHQIAQRARRLDIDLEQPHVLVAARPEGGEQGRAVVWASSYAYRMSGLKTVRSGCIVLLLPGTDASAAARAVADELAPLLGHPVSVGAAGPDFSPAEVARMYREAMRCLDALTALGGAGCAAAANDLGFLGLLLSDDYDVDGFIGAALGPVLEYDAERLTDLTRTLEAYFASGSSPTNAAEALHVHPNTVSRRLERITELLGSDWQKPGQALEVQLALRLQRARRVLRDRDGGGGGRPADDTV
ncbi:helix-turn-helix domain-containing protein [Streptomyces luteolus]|uniref:Helix-turn-helix domain-containing protein n=1 Tax=Streptomyces luteolus TaxID=3043615 RepID=A0ABT6T556_9ACTN|nr:helix-turn-helix domain-containing protein [Streptomyces sp. B-S-A12]MDI3422954.1 helix-turn-helix domain-containing protein [Streptomyces sp. B-S-A12]